MNATPKCFTPSKIFPGQNGAPFATRFLFRKLLHFRGTKNQMSAELAHQKADEQLCVALHRKVRIRLHAFVAFHAELCEECCHIQVEKLSFFLINVHELSYPRLF